MIDPVISVGAVFGILYSVLLAHRLTIEREKQKELRSAISEFKDSLSGILTDLTHPDANPSILVTQNYPEHKKAAIKLIQKLSPKMAARFNVMAWEQYHLLYEQKKSLGAIAIFAAEVEDKRKVLPTHSSNCDANDSKMGIAVIQINSMFQARAAYKALSMIPFQY